MLKVIKKISTKIRNYENKILSGSGERVNIIYNGQFYYDNLNMYQKSHYRRYEFAKNFISSDYVCGDFACGTGYGSVMLAEKSRIVIGSDINSKVIKKIKKRYRDVPNVEFVNVNLLDLSFLSFFDVIVSFETIEHFKEGDINTLFTIFNRSLRPRGKLIFSTPYMQKRNSESNAKGFHLTFNINEEKIMQWLVQNNFVLELFQYQNYQTHNIQNELQHKDFIICVAKTR